MGKIGRKKVLFICTHNSARSQMAEALLNRFHGDRYEAASAGARATKVNPYAVKVMAEIEIDISKQHSKGIEEFRGAAFDYIVTVCDRAKDLCPFFPGCGKHIHKGFDAPSAFTGTEREILNDFRCVRDEIKEFIDDTFGDRKMEEKKKLFDSLLEKVKEIAGASGGKSGKLQRICALLKENVNYCNWVGFYLVEKAGEKELVLGPFAGAPTEHTKIPFGRGICGQAADRKETFVVQDVSKERNYLSCSLRVKSEIVVPIFKRGEVVGELDIDSHKKEPFTQEDRNFLEKICEMASAVL